MKSGILVVSGLLVAGAAVAYGMTRASDAPPSAPQSGSSAASATVSVGKASEDGKAVFHLIIYPPWADAGHRAIAFYGASVTPSSLASLNGSRLTDFGSGAEPLTAVGDAYTCTARLNNVATWSAVRVKGDVLLEITPNPH